MGRKVEGSSSDGQFEVNIRHAANVKIVEAASDSLHVRWSPKDAPRNRSWNPIDVFDWIVHGFILVLVLVLVIPAMHLDSVLTSVITIRKALCTPDFACYQKATCPWLSDDVSMHMRHQVVELQDDFNVLFRSLADMVPRTNVAIAACTGMCAPMAAEVALLRQPLPAFGALNLRGLFFACPFYNLVMLLRVSITTALLVT